MAPKDHLDRKVYCGEINEAFIGKQITVRGWVQVKRELGGITFIDLRDRGGILQIVFDPNFPDREIIKKIGREFILQVEGEVIRRSSPNPELFSGQVELNAKKVSILSESELPPFFPENRNQVSEELRFKYRYLDLRREEIQQNLALVSACVGGAATLDDTRDMLAKVGFEDIKITPKDESRKLISEWAPGGSKNAGDYVVSAYIEAVKPG